MRQRERSKVMFDCVAHCAWSVLHSNEPLILRTGSSGSISASGKLAFPLSATRKTSARRSINLSAALRARSLSAQQHDGRQRHPQQLFPRPCVPTGLSGSDAASRIFLLKLSMERANPATVTVLSPSEKTATCPRRDRVPTRTSVLMRSAM